MDIGSDGLDNFSEIFRVFSGINILVTSCLLFAPQFFLVFLGEFLQFLRFEFLVDHIYF